MPQNRPEEVKLEILWTVSEVSSYLNFNPSTIYQWVKLRKIPHLRIGKKGLRFRKSTIDRWLEGLLVLPEGKDEEKIGKRILESMGKPPPDIYQIARRYIEEAKKTRYTPLREKPGKDRGLGKEGDYGTI